MKDSIKTYGILLATAVVAYVSAYPAFFLSKKGYLMVGGVGFSLMTSLFACITMVAIPLWVISKYLKKDKREFGFQLPPDTASALKLTIAALLFFLLVIAGLSSMPAFRDYYLIGHPLDATFLIEVLLSLIYFASEEFFFRGFLFFSLLERGAGKAYVLTNVLFALFHFGKPSFEVLFALLLGVVLSIVTSRTRSFVPAAFIHFAIALALNLLILLMP